MKKVFLISISSLLFALTTAKAQPTLDTINDCIKQRPSFYFGFNNRNSFIENSRAKIFGALIGVSYGNRLFCAIGYNQLYPPATHFDEQYYFVNKDNKKDSVTEKLKLYYISVSVEYAFYTTKHWYLSMPLQIGVGDTYYKYELNGMNYRVGENLNFVYEPAVSVQYKFTKYVGVGANIGYRFMFTTSRKLNQKFTSPIYAFSIVLYYSEIYRALVHKTHKKAEVRNL